MSLAVNPYLYGDGRPVLTKPTPTAIVVAPGDLVGIDGSSNPYTAADEVWDTNEATTRAAFVAAFLGVSLDRSQAGEVEPLKVNCGGVHRFACASATYEVGDLVGPAKAAGDALVNTLKAVAATDEAIGRVQRRGVAATEIYVEVFSVVNKVGV